MSFPNYSVRSVLCQFRLVANHAPVLDAALSSLVLSFDMVTREESFWRTTSLVLFLALFSALTWIAYPMLRALVIPPEITAAARGRDLARDLGCFSCHGSLGHSGIANPGSRYRKVPPFNEGTIMMFAKSDQDLREYILDGAPATKRESDSYRKEMAAQALRMPAYRDVISESQVDDLVAYLRATSEMLFPPDGPAADGEELAHEMGCFSCHGAQGSGGISNPGSLKGYIPGFYGPDFSELVHNDEELRSWIEQGGIKRFNDDELASFFIARQRVKMPGYGAHLSREQIDHLIAYVKWVSKESWREMPLQE